MDPLRSAPPRMQFIDRLRGGGILMVILYHAVLAVAFVPIRWQGWHWDFTAYPPAQALLQVALQWLWVPTLFFAISGFLIHQSQLNNPRRPAAVALRQRVLRLYVPYLIALAFFAFALPSTRLRLDSPDDLLQIATHVTLVFNLHDEGVWAINPSFWYVATELQLTLLYPLALRATRRFGWMPTLVALAVLACVLRIVSTVNGLTAGPEDPALGEDWLANSSPVYFFNWMLGAWIAERRHRGIMLTPSRADVGALFLLGLIATLVQPLSVLAQGIMGFAMAAWFARRVMAPAQARARPAALPVRWIGAGLSYLGTISLAVYLLNQPLVHIVTWRLNDYFAPSLGLILAVAILSTAAMVVAGTVFTRYFELPSVKWLQGRFDRTKARPVPLAP